MHTLPDDYDPKLSVIPYLLYHLRLFIYSMFNVHVHHANALCLVVSIWNGQSISNQPFTLLTLNAHIYLFINRIGLQINASFGWRIANNWNIYMYWFLQSLGNQYKSELIHAFKCKQYLIMSSFRNSKFNIQIVHFQNIKFHTIPFFYDASFYLNGSITKSIFNRVNYHK